MKDKVSKKELVTLIAEQTGETKVTVSKVLDAFTEVVELQLINDMAVTLQGFGTFEVRQRKERAGVKPGTTERITVPARDYPAFKAGKTLKEAIAGTPF